MERKKINQTTTIQVLTYSPVETSISVGILSKKIKLTTLVEGSLFDSYNTKVSRRKPLLSLDSSTLSLIHTL